jgi:vitamin B12 transporter
VPPNKTDNDYDRWDVGLSATGSLLEFELAGVAVGTRVVAGVDYVDEDGESDNFLDFGFGPTPFPFDEDRETWGFFGEVEEKIGPHVVVSANLRYDSTSDERDRFSPGAGLTIDIPRTPITLFGSYGEGFKRPSFYALGDPLVGDPNLDPEESRGWEVGLRASSRDGHLRGQMSYFDIEVKDLIDFDAASFSLVNRGRLISRGVEIETSWQARDWVHFLGSVTFNPTDFEGTSLQPENRPKWRGFGELRLGPVHDVEFKLRVLAVGSSKASSFATGARQITLAGYERIDVRIGWTPRDWVELFFEIQNLSDRTYREAVGFESPGIAPRIGLTLRR